MKRLKLILLLNFTFFISISAQINPMRIGGKIGLPNVIGFYFECVTPILKNRLAVSMDFTPIVISYQGNKSGFYYFDFGPNLYAYSSGKGPYVNLSYGRVAITASANDGEQKAKVTLNMMNIKLGTKWGDRFYFRPEIGYRFMGKWVAHGSDGSNSATASGSNVNFLGRYLLPYTFTLGLGFAFGS